MTELSDKVLILEKPDPYTDDVTAVVLIEMLYDDFDGVDKITSDLIKVFRDERKEGYAVKKESSIYECGASHCVSNVVFEVFVGAAGSMLGALVMKAWIDWVKPCFSKIEVFEPDSWKEKVPKLMADHLNAQGEVTMKRYEERGDFFYASYEDGNKDVFKVKGAICGGLLKVEKNQ